MNITGLRTGRFRLKLRIMSQEDLWWLFLHHREECAQEFWEELQNRKAAGILSKDSPVCRHNSKRTGNGARPIRFPWPVAKY